MGNFKFALSMLVKESKKSFFYGITLVFTIAVTFIFFNIINNDYLKNQGIVSGGATWKQVQVPFSTSLSFLIIIFCCFMIFFANDFFISRKTSEIAIMTLSGNSTVRSTLYLIYQTFTLLLIATPFGIGIGRLITPLINYMMYQYLNVHASIYKISINTYLETLIVIIIILATLSVFASGYIYRNDISFLLHQEKAMDINPNNEGKIKPILFISLYFIGIVMMFMAKHSANNYIMPTAVGIVAMIGVIKYFLPEFVKWFKKKYLLEKRYALIYVSNLAYSIRRALLLIALLMVMVTGMIVIIATYYNSPREFITAFIGYIVLTILLVISLIYKYCMEAQTRTVLFLNLWKIGYTRNEVKKVIKREVFYFYWLLLLIPLIYVLFIAGRFVYYQQLSISLALVICLIYLIAIIISGLLTSYNYQKLVMVRFKGGK